MQNYITKEGLKKVQEELSHLKTVKRRELTERLRKAISFGDLSENFDYHNAKEEQEMLERRIAELEDMISQAKVVEHSGKNGKVQVGSQITLQTGKDQWVITLTGPQEADPTKDKISASSPLGEALLGRKKGEEAEVDTPQGKVRYKILEIA